MTVWTIRIALALFLLSIASRIVHRRRDQTASLARMLWTLATFAFVAHVVAAFVEVHDWSHAAAVQHTAEVTDRVVGIRVGIGIYFNHLFTVLCIGESIWWWINPIGYQTRKRWWNWIILGYLAFIGFNGAIVFEGGPTRWFSILAVIALVALAARKRTKSTPRVESP